MRASVTLCSLALICQLSVAAGAPRAPGPGQQQSPEQSKAFEEVIALLGSANKLRAEGKLGAAAAELERALGVGEKAFGEGHLVVAIALDMLATVYFQQDDFERSEKLYLRALAVREKLQGPEHPDLATTLTGLGSVYTKRENFAESERAYRRALAIREKAYGPEHPEVAGTLYSLATTHSRRGDYGRAEPLLLRALQIQEKATEGDNFSLALTLNNLAYLYSETGEYAKSEQLFLRSLALLEKMFGPDHALVATPLNSLAALYRGMGDYLRAEPMLKRALLIQERAAGAEHPDTAIALVSLAILYSDMGDDERALPLYERALAIREKTEPGGSTLASTLGNIAHVYSQRGEHARAAALYERALPLVEKTLGAETSLYATLLNGLAVTYLEREDYAKAEPLLRRSLAIKEKTLGPDHPDVAIALSNLAHLFFAQNDFTKEESLYRRAIGIAEKAYGPDHPAVGAYLANLATVYWGLGDTRQTLAALERNAELRERNLAVVLSAFSEEQKRSYMQTLSNETEAITSFHVQMAPDDAAAAALSLTTTLRRKGRVLDAMTDQIASLRRRLDPQDGALLERLAAARSARAALLLKAERPGGAAERARLQAEIERLESEVGARSREFRAQAQPVTLSALRQALPAAAALVEIVSYRPYDPKKLVRRSRFGARRYVAYVVRRDGDTVWADLGEAEKIDREVGALRRALSDPSSRDVRERARTLDESVMRPVRKLLGAGARHVFLSPDGALNLVPFAALVDEQNRYLVETYTITYLTSGRDLLRLQAGAVNREGPVVVANPLFGAGAQAAAGPGGAAQARRSADLANTNFSPLPGTKGEAAALATILPGARVYTEAQASEALLKRVGGPAVLHVATHGFFLPDQTPPAAAGDPLDAAARGLSLGTPGRAGGENPLLRSGLALAGANRGLGGAGEDGVLTALEAAGLDLWGTKLVVLSACETGVGEVSNGDGVYGLRRALVLAGSESQVMSLWQVSDAATRDLMVSYYKRLRAGEGRTEALRQVQLTMLREGGSGTAAGGGERGLGGQAAKAGDYRHPYYWASFIQSGDWRAVSIQQTGVRSGSR